MTPLMKRATVIVLFAAFGLASAGSAFADSSSDMMNVLESMKRQMTEMQNTINQQNNRIQQLESRELQQPGTAIQGPAGTAPSMSDTDWQKGIKDNLNDVVPWMKGLKFGGDLRLREEYFDYYDKNNDAGSTGTTADRNRARTRARLRFGFEKDYGDDWRIGFRLATSPNSATGQPQDQVSTNQTLGNTGYFAFKSVNIDRMFAEYAPTSLKDYGPVKGAKIGAGKFDNPLLRYETTIVWDADATPEGAYEKVNFNLLSTEENKLNLYTTFGQFILNENAAINQDALMFAYQGALDWTTYNFDADHAVDFTSAVTFYDYKNFFQTITSSTIGTSLLRTNTSALDDPQILSFYEEAICYPWTDKPVTLWYNYVENVGTIDQSRIDVNNVHGEDTAWGLGVKWNKMKKKGDWELFYGYYEIGANAVVAAFGDSDFGGPGTNGFTNRKGHKFGLGYQITDNVAFNWTNYLVSPLNATTSSVSANSLDEAVYRLQADLVWKF